MKRITFEIDNRKDLNLLISIAEKLGIKKIIYNDIVSQKSIQLRKIYQIIEAGADISTFGDVKEWQRTTRSDRNLNFNKI